MMLNFLIFFLFLKIFANHPVSCLCQHGKVPISFSVSYYNKLEQDYQNQSSISIELENVEFLNVLSVSSDVISSGMFNITRPMGTLDISVCELTKIEPHFLENRIKKLYDINFYGNSIEILEKHTFTNIDVEWIRLTSNSIFVIESEAFYNLSVLRGLYLGENRISKFSNDQFKLLPQMIYFDLNDNSLEVLSRKSFDFLMENNAKLDFAGNSIEEVDKDVFEGLTAEYINLYVEENLLKTVPTGLFNDHHFVYVNLGNNQIENLPEEICTRNCTIEYLALKENPLNGSFVKNLEKWVKKNHIRLYSSSTYFYPCLQLLLLLFPMYSALIMF